MKKTMCWWIIGRDNITQRAAMSIAVHDENGELLEQWSRGLSRPGWDVLNEDGWMALWDEARSIVEDYGARHGISQFVYDDDSTDMYANC